MLGAHAATSQGATRGRCRSRSRPDGREALVVLATNEEPYVEPYEVVCYREGDRRADEVPPVLKR